MRGFFDNFCLIKSAITLKSFVDVHSSFGFMITIMSEASGGIGSVAISAEPVLPITIFTSGRVLNIISAIITVSVV